MNNKPVYQIDVSKTGVWFECTQEQFEEIKSSGAAFVDFRILYPSAAYEALENERDELKQSLDDLQERFNGIKFIESELRKELAELTAERNRHDEMRKALAEKMGISNKRQS